MRGRAPAHGGRGAAYVVVLVLATIAMGCPTRADTIRWDPIKLPVAEPDGKTVDLDGIVLRPDDGEKHPLALINHGSPRDVKDIKTVSPFGLWSQAMLFARRGWTVVVFTRHGYGRSGGDWQETYGRCNDPDFTRSGWAAASDIAGVAAVMRRQPYVAPGRWISVGVSAGGFATIALTARAPPGLAAAIAFAPGRGSVRPDFVCGEDRLIHAFATFGRTSRTPPLWVNAENDHFFGPELVTRMVAAFSGAGGRPDHVVVPPFGAEGHLLFTKAGQSIWAPIVDRFLSAQGLTLRDRPIDVQPPDVSPPESLDAKGRSAFAAYLADGPNKAFAVAPGGHFGWATERATTEDASAVALDYCRGGVAGRSCALVNVNDAPRP